MARPKGDAAPDQSITVPISEIVGLKEELTRILTHLHTGLITLQNAAADSIRVANMAPNRLLATAGVSSSTMGFTPLQPIMANVGSFAGAPAVAAAPAATTLVEVPILDGKGKKQKREKKIKDPNAPPRPVTAYFLFLKEKRPELKLELGENSAPGEVQNLATERWKELSEKDKEKYKTRYKENWAKYEKALEAYKAQGGIIAPEAFAPADDDAVDALVSAQVDLELQESTPAPAASKKAKDNKKAKGTPASKAAASPAVTKEKSPEKKKKAAAAAPADDNKKKRKSDAAAEKPKKKKKSEA